MRLNAPSKAHMSWTHALARAMGTMSPDGFMDRNRFIHPSPFRRQDREEISNLVYAVCCSYPFRGCRLHEWQTLSKQLGFSSSPTFFPMA